MKLQNPQLGKQIDCYPHLKGPVNVHFVFSCPDFVLVTKLDQIIKRHWTQLFSQDALTFCVLFGCLPFQGFDHLGICTVTQKLEYHCQQCQLCFLVTVSAVFCNFFPKPSESLLRHIVNGLMHQCDFQTVLKIPFQEWGIQQDFLGWKGRNQLLLIVPGLALAVDQLVFYVLPHCFTWNRFIIEKRWHFFKNLPQLSGDLTVHFKKPNHFSCKIFQCFLALAANAQQPPYHTACCLKLYSGTGCWHCKQERFDTVLIYTNEFLFYQPCVFNRKQGSGPWQPCFQHFISLLDWGVQLQAISLILRTLQEIFHQNPR